MIKNLPVHLTYQVLIILIASNLPNVNLPGIVWLCPLFLLVFGLYKKIASFYSDLIAVARDEDDEKGEGTGAIN